MVERVHHEHHHNTSEQHQTRHMETAVSHDEHDHHDHASGGHGQEEPYLYATHGEAYAHYAARVGRFLPDLGRLKHPRRNASPP